MFGFVLPRFAPVFLLISLIFVPFSAVSAENDMVWQFSEGNDPDNKGRVTARLVYGVPETDEVLVSAVCDGGPSTGTALSSVTFGADIGELEDGENVELRFSGGGFSHVVAGEIYGATVEEGVTGVVVDLKHDDKLWDGLTQKKTIDYLVPGYRATTLNLKKGRSKIKSFIRTCRDYADAVLGNTRRDKGEGADDNEGSTAISQKEAFESAKELGTIEAWDAFLNSYPKGFRADLARAYVKRLGSANEGTTDTGNTDADSEPIQPGPPPPVPPVTSDPGFTDVQPGERALSTIDLGAGRSRWVNDNRRFALSSGRSLYTASVRSKGVELITFCMDNNMSGGFGYRLGTVVRQSALGSYPQYDARVRQGLAQSLFLPNNKFKKIGISFSNGQFVYGGAVSPSVVGGELAIGSTVLGFGANSSDLENFMAAGRMSVSLPPFAASFQLTGSRKAICNVMQRCGARPQGCGRYRPAPVVHKKTCRGGQYYSKRRGRCVCRKGQYFSKGRCRWRQVKCKAGFELVNGKCFRNEELDGPGSFCGPGFKLVNGKCISQADLPQNPSSKPAPLTQGSGGCIGGQVRLANGNCVCPKGFQYINKKCVSIQQLQQNLKQIFSDYRLKRDITHLTTLESGIKVYSFRYQGDGAVQVGVMAQDLLGREGIRGAVVMTRYGYYAVDYAQLGLQLISLADWQEGGRRALFVDAQ